MFSGISLLRMKVLKIIFVLICLPTGLFAQFPEPTPPVYTKLILNNNQCTNSSLIPNKDASNYFALWQNFNTSLDIGVFDENNNDTLNPDLSQKIFFYDDQLNPLNNCLEIGVPSFTNSYRKKLIMAGYINDQWWFSLKSGGYSSDGNFISEPTPVYLPSDLGWSISVFGYTPSTQALNVALLSQGGIVIGGSGNFPFPGFQNAASVFAVGNTANANKFDFVKTQDGQLAVLSEYAGLQIINGVSYDTQVPNTSIYKYGFFQMFIDPATNQTVVHPVLSDGGEMVFRRLFPGSDTHSGYRIMVVRGDSVKLGWNEPPLVLDNDSLYRILLIKDNYQTNQIDWKRELYSYNNAAKDSVIIDNVLRFTVLGDFESLVEVDGNMFLSNRIHGICVPSDTLYWTDSYGNTSISPSENDLPNPNTNIVFAKSEVLKVDSMGNALRTLWFDELPMLNSGYPKVLNSPELYKVQDYLVWKISFRNNEPTTIPFYITTASGNTESVAIETPAGQSILLVWLNDQLEIQNHWLFPYSTPTYPTNPEAMDFQYIGVYQEDSLFIQGNFYQGISTSFDPTGASEPVSYSSNGTFFNFYALPFVPNGVLNKDRSKDNLIQVFPNPAKSNLNITFPTVHSGSLNVYDISGRIVLGKNISSGSNKTDLDISRFDSGVYLIRIQSEEFNGCSKFVVNR